jgi:tRNA U34 5-carboxymethylaminomethyl modifying enzyme MnmG/GidA
MDIKLIAVVTIGLVMVLVVIVLYILFAGKKKKSIKKRVKKKQVKKKEVYSSLEELKAIIKKKTSSSEELSNALDLVIKYHGYISEQSAGKRSTSFDTYIDILVTICRHPNTNKNIIINFDSALSKKNPTYKSSIDNIVRRGLDTR